ncbi:hypothetical protein KC19_1G189600 [Ceratodon purpureus]|uniref:Uncharacterized protein n=1 Tax=Ceratodon purpureus TaxID=3225 RepID=A0A8T0J7J6_CERPU|nr:hypothetical protein KC19_1G189600 [Ceratodon purpureus]
MYKQMPKCDEFLIWILMVSISPIAIIVLIVLALLNMLQFFFKAALLFSIVSIHTPFAVLNIMSSLLFYKLVNLYDPSTDTAARMGMDDPRSSVGIEIQVLVSDFFKVIAAELLLVLSTGVITFYTAPRQVFYASMAVGVAAILMKWLNTHSLSKTAFSCLCDGYGLNPLMFFFSFIGLFDIGCHPVAKCSFVASKAFLFTNENPKLFNGEVTESENMSIKFDQWDAFEEGLFELGLFELYPRIDFITRNIRNHRKYILKSSMVLKSFGVDICDYPVERLELPEDYGKRNELLNFLLTLAEDDGFVTDKMRGRYENSLTLLEIVGGVGQHNGYRTVQPEESQFVVAGSTNHKYY